MPPLANRPRLPFCLRFLVLLLMACYAASNTPLRADEMETDSRPWALDFQGARGLTLAYDGVPIIRQSSLYVVKPGWSGLWFDGRNQKYRIEKGAGAQPSLKVVGENTTFRAEYNFEVLDARRFRLRFKGELKQDVAASLEYAAGYFNANLLANRTFRAQTTQGERTGRVPSYPASGDQMANDVAPQFRSLEFDSRLGKLAIRVRSASRVVFFDARRDPQEWAKNAPTFWCGWLGGTQPLRFGQPVELTLDLTLDATPVTAQSGLTSSPKTRPVAMALSARERPLQIIPRPQKLELLSGKPFLISQRTPLVLTVPRGETRLTNALKRVMNEAAKLSELAPQVVEHDEAWASITLGKAPMPDLGTAQPTMWWQNPEGYRLRVSGEGIEILAPTARGAFYGLQTLAQALRMAPQGATCPALAIEDWPTRTFRGAHWFPSSSGVPFHKKLIGDVLARYKFNTCVIQCEAARWDTDPQIAAPNSISKADLRDLVQTCRDNFIEPIPLINIPGHAEWMFRNGRNLDLAEDPATPYAYSVKNPKSLAFVEAILSEAIEVFHPRIFHLGHDEVTMRGRFPNPDNPFYIPDNSAGDLVLENLRHFHDWLSQRDIKTMIWSDMLLSKAEGIDAAQAPDVAEAQHRRALVPLDVIVADWHYGSNEIYPSLALFKEAGLKTVSATWQTPANIRNFARASQGYSLGLLQTTWAGFFPDESTLKTETRQFAAFILAGDYSWSNRAELPAELPYDPIAEWTNAYDGGNQNRQERSGQLVGLGPIANVKAADWLGLGTQWDLSAFTASIPAKVLPRYDDVLFVPTKGSFVVLGNAKGRGLIPAKSLAFLEMKVTRKVHEVALLHAALWPTPVGTAVGRMVATYSDGTQASWDVIEGRNIAAWQGDNGASEARRGWIAPKTSNAKMPRPEGGYSLRVAHWQNPYPDKAIASLRLEPLAPESGWAIAGLTLLD